MIFTVVFFILFVVRLSAFVESPTRSGTEWVHPPDHGTSS